MILSTTQPARRAEGRHFLPHSSVGEQMLYTHKVSGSNPLAATSRVAVACSLSARCGPAGVTSAYPHKHPA
jgi:hypothetical protein